MTRKKLGIVLIVVAVLIGLIFLYEMTRKEKPEQVGEQKVNTVTSSAIMQSGNFTGEPTAAPTPTPISESNNEILCEIRSDILDYMQVSAGEVSKQLRIYANSCGYSAATKVEDMDEMMVNYAKKTITVPCYFTLGKRISKFDMVYQYEKKTYRFVPW